MNEDNLIIGKEYYLNNSENVTGVFIKKNKNSVFFRRKKGIGYAENKDGSIGFRVCNYEYKAVEDENN